MVEEDLADIVKKAGGVGLFRRGEGVGAGQVAGDMGRREGVVPEEVGVKALLPRFQGEEGDDGEGVLYGGRDAAYARMDF